MNSPAAQRPFPVERLPETIRNAVKKVQTYNGAPMALVASSALGTVSLVCQNSVDVCGPTGLVFPSSLFLLTLADSGERKSACDKLFMEAVKEFQESQAEQANSELSKYETDLLIWEITQKALLSVVRKQALEGVNDDL